MSIQQISEQAQLAHASYGALSAGMSTQALLAALQAQNDGFVETQAQQFAAKHSVVLQYDDASPGGNSTGLSLTVFEDNETHQLTLAIRGTTAGDSADYATNASILFNGAGYDQIAALYNWWGRASATFGTLVPQYVLSVTDQGDPNALEIPGGYLVRKADVAATGELQGALGTDPDQRLDVTGHSMGGHLAMAFGALFGASTASVTTFNAPAFRDNTPNQAFFAQLGGALPTQTSIGAMTTNVVANEAAAGGSAFNPIAGLGTLPGVRVDVPIENQTDYWEPVPASSSNHSQMIISDALAVYALLDKLSLGLSTSSFGVLLGAAADKEFAGLEGLVGSLRATLGLGSASLAPGNGQREELYAGIKSITDSTAIVALTGKVDLVLASTGLASDARGDFALLLALQVLSPLVLRAKPGEQSTVEGALAGGANTASYTAWLADKTLSAAEKENGKANYSDAWLSDRAAMLSALVLRNQSDMPNGVVDADGLRPVQYTDVASGVQFQIGPNDPLGDKPQIWFGGNADETSNGKSLSDHLYGGGGNDTLKGGGGNDHVEGNADSDTLEGGAGDDTLLGGTGDDFYDFNGADFGSDMVIDQDGLGQIRWNGAPLPQGLKAFDDVWQSADKQVSYTLVADAAAGRQDLVVSFAGSNNRIIVRNWDIATRNLGIGFGADMPVPATTQTYLGDFNKKDDGSTYELSGGNYVADGVQLDAADQITGSVDNEAFHGLGGDDAILGREGDDYIDGGAGGDVLMGGLGSDRILGGNGNDLIYGSSQGALSNPTAVGFTPPVADFPVVTARGFNWVASGVRDGEGIVSPFLQFTVSRDDGDGDAGNVIDAGAGEDVVLAGQGDDLVQAGADADEVLGMAGADVLLGGSGGDRLFGDGRVAPDAGYVDDAPGVLHGADILVGGAGNDILLGQGNDDILYGGADDDVLWGDDRDLSITTVGFHGADLLFGGAGRDHLYGGARDDQLYGDTEDDLLWGDSGGAATSSASYFAPSEHGNDELHGGAGNDQLVGEGGADRLYGDGGDDVMAGDFDVQTLAAAFHGDDYLDGGDGNDTLFGGGGNDHLIGGTGNDWLAGEDQLDVVASSTLSGDDRLEGGDGDDTLIGGNGNDVLIGGAGVDYLVGGQGNDLFDIAGAETRDVGGVPTLLVDTVVATQGQDTIRISAANSADLFVTRSGEGTLFVRNATEGVGIVAGVTSSVGNFELADGSISLRRLVNDRLTSVVVASTDRSGGGLLGGSIADTLTVRAQDTESVVSAGKGNDSIRIDSTNGSTLQMARGDGTDTLTAVARSSGSGTAPKNVLQIDEGILPADVRLVWRSNGWHVLSLGAGDGLTFQVSGWTSASAVPSSAWPVDEIRFADGTVNTMADVIARGVYVLPNATEGDDVVTLTPLSDTFYALGGNDWVDGGDGDDFLFGGSGNDTLMGGAGSDTLNSGYGTNDLMLGGEGNDSYSVDSYTTASAVDEAQSDDTYYFSRWLDSSGSPQRFTIADSGGVDTLVASSVAPGDIRVRNTGTALEIKWGNYSNSSAVVLEGVFTANGETDTSRLIERVQFSNGTVWSAADLLAQSLLGTSDNDTLRGFSSADIIDGGAGNDYIYGGRGNDVLSGGAGVDSLFGEAGNDTLSAGADGGTLIGGDGDDTYVVSAGEGTVLVGTQSFGNDPGFDVLRFQATRGNSIVSIVRGNPNTGIPDVLAISTLDGSVQARVTLLGNATGADLAVDRIEFLDGSVETLGSLAQPQFLPYIPYPVSQQARTIGTSLGEIITGPIGWGVYAGMGDDILIGTAGDDSLYGEMGNDEFRAGAGADWIDLGGGANTVVLTVGQGDDRVSGATSYAEPTGSTQTLLADATMVGMSIGYKWLLPDWTNPGYVSLKLSWNAAADSLIIDAQNVGDALLYKLRMPDGTEISSTSMIDSANTATSGDDTLVDAAGRNSLQGDAGNDDLLGFGGDDNLQGGAGNDRLDGGVGNDTLVGGAGNDTLRGGGGVTTVVYASGDGIDRLEPIGIGESLVLNLGAGISTSQIGFTVARSSNTYDFDRGVKIGSGSVTVGAANDSTQFFQSINFDGGLTWDRAAILNAMTSGTAGNDTLAGFDDTDDFLLAGAGTDTLYGGKGSDHLLGGDGNDTLYATGTRSADWWDSGVDVLEGGAGADILYGVSGTHFVFEQGFGKDAIYMNNGAGAVVQFGAGIDPSQVRTRITPGGDLVFWLPETGDEVRRISSGSQLSSLAQIDPIERVDFANSAAWTWTDVLARSQAGSELDDLLVGGAGDDTLLGLGGDDSLFGGAGIDRLSGGGGVDKLTGGAGQDVYVFAPTPGASIVTDVEAGERVQVDAPVNPADLTVFTDWAGNLAIRHEQANATMLLTGSSNLAGNNDLVVQFAGGASWNLADLRGRAASGIAIGSNGNDGLNATSQATLLLGLGGNDDLTGGAAADLLDGGLGNDRMSGGAGDDIYVVDSTGDVTTEASNAGADTVRSWISWTLGTNIENLELQGSTAINATGNTLNNQLRGNAAANTLNGGTGADALTGGSGDDLYIVDNIGDTTIELSNEGIDRVQAGLTWTLASNVENLTLSGSNAINGTGNALDNVINGNSGANVLTGGAGNDVLAGGAGNDTYVVDSVGDSIVEAAAGGTDTVQSSIGWTLGSELENLTLTGTSAINGTGNGLNNVLTGNTSDNILDGGAGNDTMAGGTGNDTYLVDSVSDVVTEAATAGTDTVLSSVAFTLASNVENLTLTGASAINGTGNTLNNVIRGNAAANTLSGGSGADAMTGGAGNDTYVVDNAGDTTIELAGEGSDLVQSTLTWTLASNVENLTLSGSNAINGTGNALDNVINGNSGANVLTGGAGNDVLAGGAGNDTYVVDSAGDSIVEAAAGGTDTVQSSISWTLGSELENLTLTGTAAINATGNTLVNVLRGNAANNTLSGGTGSDTMIGGAGNDTYVVDATGDVVTENAAEGVDLVQSAVTYTLAGNVENLTLTGTTAVNGTGNTLDNTLTGNSGANTLTGNAGNDTLDGGAGADTLIGGAGNDKYLMGRGYGAELVQDNDATAGNTDLMQFMAGVATDQIWFRKLGNDLEVSIIGTTDKATVQNWYLGNQYHVEQFKTSDGKTLLDSKVQDLVSAMAAFTPPAVGQTTLPASYQTTLLPIIAADWGP